MEIGPIFRAMMRNKLGVLLIALQIALTMTVMVNAIFIINERAELMNKPSGLDEPNIFYVISNGFGDDFNEVTTSADDLAMLRQTPGIVNASVISAIPMSGSGSSTGVRLDSDLTKPSVGTAMYTADEQIFDTMNVDLIAGEYFTALDMQYRDTSGFTNAAKTVVSRALVEDLFPDTEPTSHVGETLFMPAGNTLQIVGIVDILQASWPTSTLADRSMVVPEQYIDGFSYYMVRTEPGQRDRLMAQVEQMLVASNPNRVVRDLRSMEETRQETFRVESALSTILWTIVVMLLFITGMGIVGLAVFSINRRRKQIGTRRALGATRGEILRHFMVENLLITGVGVVLGAAMTVGLSIALSTMFNMPAMAWYYTAIGMGVLLLLGQIAVLGPSNGASRIQPAIATRSV